MKKQPALLQRIFSLAFSMSVPFFLFSDPEPHTFVYFMIAVGNAVALWYIIEHLAASFIKRTR